MDRQACCNFHGTVQHYWKVLHTPVMLHSNFSHPMTLLPIELSTWCSLWGCYVKASIHKWAKPRHVTNLHVWTTKTSSAKHKPSQLLNYSMRSIFFWGGGFYRTQRNSGQRLAYKFHLFVDSANTMKLCSLDNNYCSANHFEFKDHPNVRNINNPTNKSVTARFATRLARVSATFTCSYQP